MKISDIELKMEHGDYSEEMLDLFKNALKCVPQNDRCQHCYITAAKMPIRCHKQAIAIIEYGLSEYCNSWSDRMRSYDCIAGILEKLGDYLNAQKAYNQALLSVEIDKKSSYDYSYATHMMRMEMHISNFKYTEDLENYYNIAIRADDFFQAFQYVRFYRMLAEIIIFNKHGETDKAKDAFLSANEMLSPNYTGPLTALLKEKRYTESNRATKEAKAFLKRAKRFF